jgi:hypothetical protein
MKLTTCSEVSDGFDLPASQRQIKKITSLRSLRLCGENSYIS